MVLAWDETTRTTGLFTVTDVLVHIDPVQVHLSVGGEFIETTPEHPFYTLERGWVDAGDLWLGAHIRRANGSFAPVLFIEVETETQVMYNLTVAEAHTFFVGTQRALVHNADCSSWAKKFHLNPNSQTTQQLYNNRNITVQEYLAKFRAGNIKGRMPAEALLMTVEEALRKERIGNVNVRKLLNDGRDKFTK